MATRNDLLRERVELIAKIKDLQKSEGVEAAKLTKEYVRLKGELTKILTTLNDARVQSEEMLSGMVETRDTTKSLGSLYNGITSSMTEQLRLQRNVTDVMSLQSVHSNNVYSSLNDQTRTISEILDSYSTLSGLSTELANIGDKTSSRYNDILGQMDVERSKIGEQLNLLGDKTDLAREFLQLNNDLADSSKLQVDDAIRLSSISKSGDTDIAITLQESLNSKIAEQSVLQERANQLGLSHLMNMEESKSALDSQHEVLSNINDSYNTISKSAAELAQTSVDDIQTRLDLQTTILQEKQSIAEQVQLLDEKNEASKLFLSTQNELNKSIDRQIQQAQGLSLLSEKEKRILDSQAETYNTIRGYVDSLGATLTTFIKRPQSALGAMVIGFGDVVNKVGDVNKELGLTVFETNKASASAGALSLFFDDTAGTVKALTNEFGSLESATFDTQLNVGLMASTMGISNTEASGLMGSFARMNGGSTDIASDMIATTKEFAKQNNVIPADVLSDMAGSAEQFALFANEGGKNMIEAAVGARQLGTNIGTVGNIAEGLLDFESSITKELELGALLGKNVNLNKARQLAYDGDILGATKETLKQVGGIAAFNKMDYYQKKATADMMGISVAELQKMADNQSKIGEQGQMIKETFSQWGTILDGGLSKYLGTSIEGLGGMITMTGELGRGFETLSSGAKGIGGAFSWVKKTMGGVKKVTETASTVADGAKEGMELGKTGKDLVPNGGVGGGLKGLAEGLKEMGSGKVLFGALNMIPTALGMVTILPGIPGMAGISLLGASAGVGLVSLGKGLEQMGTGKVTFGALNLIPTALGMTLMTAGAIGLGAIALLGIPAGLGLGGLSKGMSQLGNGKVIVGSIALILLAGGLTLMGYAMGLFAQNADGILPAIGALVAFGLAAAVIGSFAPLILMGSLAIAALGASLYIFGMGIQSISEGLTPLLTALSDVTGTVGSLIILGVGLFSVAGGLIALGLAAPFAFMAMIPLMMLAGLGSKLESVSSGFQVVGDGIRGIMDSVSMEKVAGLFLLGPALLSASAGLVVFSASMLAASVGGGLSSLFGGGIMDTLTELSGLSPQLTLVATALTTIATSIGLLVASLGGLNIDKLNELTNIDIPESISKVQDPTDLSKVQEPTESISRIQEVNITEKVNRLQDPTDLSKVQEPTESISRIQEVDVTEKVNKVKDPTDLSKVQEPTESISRIQEVDVTEKVNKVKDPTESISKLQEPEKLGKQDVSIPTSITTDITDITNSVPETLLTTLTSISDMAPNISLTSTALSSMGSAIGEIVTALESLSIEKLNSLSEFSMSSIGSGMGGIVDTISGVLGSVTGVVQGETLSEYETQMMQKMDQLIQAVNQGRDVYMDKEKVTNVVMKMTERSSKNMFGLENA